METELKLLIAPADVAPFRRLGQRLLYKWYALTDEVF